MPSVKVNRPITREDVNNLSTTVNNLEWRRSKVLELSSQDYTQSEIAKTLQVSQPSVNRDLIYLARQAPRELANAYPANIATRIRTLYKWN